ncbi:ATP-binding protein [Helicovermis profundi]|uniref:histidine kinase n=1 Tax=Helicovermis profundi TaxID=3065157 RepID=A0AAU9EJ59_9FIRM|nr:hypothetical protein HLPR_19590 [Clostridia bacterium S502]
MKKIIIITFILMILFFYNFSIINYSDNSKIIKELNFVGVNNNFPYIFNDKNGKAKGLIVDILNEISKESNYKINFILTSPQNIISTFNEKGDILFSDNYIDSSNYNYKNTVPFLTIRNHIFAYKNLKELLKLKSYDNHSIIDKSLKNKQVGIKNKELSINMGLLYTNKSNLITFDNYSEGLLLLKNKKVDLVIMPETTGKALIRDEGYSNLLISKKHIFLENYFFTVKNENTALLDELNKQILLLQKGTFISETNSKWISNIQVNSINYSYLKYFNIIIFLTIIYILYLIYKSNSLKNTVENKEFKINEQKEINEELLSELLKHEKVKNDYFINLSHELRTPLNVILGATQLSETYIKKENYTKLIENAAYHNSIIKNNGYRLLRVINNIIDINKFDIDEYVINIDFVDIVYILEEIINSTKQYVNMKNLKLNFTSDIDEKIIQCDPFEIDRVFMNLLSNAIKFSKIDGEIWINIYDESEGIKIVFKDNGIGIPKEKQSSIFKRFSQVDNNLNRAHEGNGIGLYLVKSIINLHGGTIELESEENIGTTFTIFLPTKSNYTSTNTSNGINSNLNNQYNVDLEFSEIIQENLQEKN